MLPVRQKGDEQMRRTCTLAVPGGNTYLILASHLEALQHQGAALGNTLVPILLRLGMPGAVTLQPVTARHLLAEIDGLVERAEDQHFPAVHFLNREQSRLGELTAWVEEPAICEDETTRLFIGESAIRVVVRGFPPPVGFRTGLGLVSGEHECYFTQIRRHGEGWVGERTAQMGGTGAPVPLSLPPLPPPSRWDFAKVASGEGVWAVRHVLTPVPVALADLIHAVRSACTESLRLRHPLRITVEH